MRKKGRAFLRAFQESRKGVITTVLAVLLLLMLAGAANTGQETASNQVEIENPQYASQSGSAGVSGSNPVPAAAAASNDKTVVCRNAEELKDCLRQSMLARAEQFSVKYKKTYRDDVLNSNTFQELMEAAFAEDDPDQPQDFDYLGLSWTKAGFTAASYEKYVIYHFTFSYLTTASEEKQLDTAVHNAAALLDSGEMTETQKIEAVNDYVVEHVNYDYTGVNRSAYDAMAKGTSICRGYSLLTYRLLNELGIPARIITGVSNGGPHAWNIVKVGNVWYNLDVTWNDTTETNRYFLKNDSDFSDHARDAEFTAASFYRQYPMTVTSWAK